MNKEEINIKIPGQILDYVDTKEHLLDLFNYITNLQQENKQLKEELELVRCDLHNAYSWLNTQEQLKELCNEYEEELNTIFKLWKKDIERIDKVICYLNEIQEDFNNRAINEPNLYIFESCIKGVTKILEIKEILKGGE